MIELLQKLGFVEYHEGGIWYFTKGVGGGYTIDYGKMTYANYGDDRWHWKINKT
jgi:hypothetical protein